MAYIILIVTACLLFLIEPSGDQRLQEIDEELKGLEDWRQVKKQKGLDQEVIDREYAVKKDLLLYEKSAINNAIQDADDNELWG